MNQAYDFNQSGNEGFMALLTALRGLEDGDTLTIHNDVTDWSGFQAYDPGDPTDMYQYECGEGPDVWCSVFLSDGVTIQGPPDASPRVSIGGPSGPLTRPLIRFSSDVTVKDLDFYVEADIDDNYPLSEFGAVASGLSGDSTLSKVSVYGTINVWTANLNAVGGLVGNVVQSGVFYECENYASITVRTSASLALGGILGQANIDDLGQLTIIRNINHGPLDNTTECGSMNPTAGIVGFVYTAREPVPLISECVNTAEIRGLVGVAGIAGMLMGVESACSFIITDCGNEGVIKGSYAVGGIMGCDPTGESNGGNRLVQRCENSGGIFGEMRAGGIVGIVDYTHVLSCVNTGGVTMQLVNGSNFPYCSESADVLTNNIPYGVGLGGIAGASVNSRVADCHNTGVVANREGYSLAGGIAGVVFNYSFPLSDGSTDWKPNCVSECTNDGNIMRGGYIGGIVGAAFGRTGDPKEAVTIEKCVNRGGVRGTAAGAGGIVGYALGRVDIQYNRTCSSAGMVRSYVCCAGGVLGMMMYDASIVQSLGLDPDEESISRVRIMFNAVGAMAIRVIDSSGSSIPGVGVRRIIGYAAPFIEDMGTNLKGYGFSMTENFASPAAKLLGDNRYTEAFDVNEANLIGPGIAYADEPVKPDDPERTMTRMNGGDLGCQSGGLNDCGYCVVIGRCPDDQAVVSDYVTGPTNPDNPCRDEVIDEIAGVLDALARMRMADARYLAAQRVREGLFGAQFTPEMGASFGPPESVNAIIETENALSKAQCCAAQYLQCCCVSKPNPCVLCLQSANPSTGDVVPGALYSLTSADGKERTALTDEQGIVRFTLPEPGAYQLAMKAPPDGEQSDPAVYTINVSNECEISYSVNPI